MLTKSALRDKIAVAEKMMESYPQVVIEPKHYFVPGAYIREITIPAGVMLTSKTHRTKHISIMLTGDMTIPTQGGQKRITAPQIEIGEAGSKRIGLAHEDSRWITIHLTDETDLNKIEAEQFEDDGVFDFATGQVKPEKQINIDRADFGRMLAEIGFSRELVRVQSENETDRRDIDLASLGVVVAPSPIEGMGIFATRAFTIGADIGLARIEGMRTQLGRYTNHSSRPNAHMILDGSGDVWLVTGRGINEGEEITIDYRQAVVLATHARAKEVKPCQV
jgi:ssRNA-specific RNase YbeY (16S rRNA maturation enzyme)